GRVLGGLCSHSPFEFELLKSAAVTRLLMDEAADVVFNDGASSGSADGNDTRGADVAGIARGRLSEPDPGRADANRQRAAGPQGERRATKVPSAVHGPKLRPDECGDGASTRSHK